MANATMQSTTKNATRFNTRIDIPAAQREAVVDLLNKQLATLSDLYTQTKYAHWNVRGREFIAVHKLFDELAEEVEEAVDTVAERVSSLGGVARGTARMAVANSALKEFPENVFECMDVVNALADRYAQAAKQAREAIDQADDHNDKSSADVFTEVSRMLDHSLYFLEAHLEK